MLFLRLDGETSCFPGPQFDLGLVFWECFGAVLVIVEGGVGGGGPIGGQHWLFGGKSKDFTLDLQPMLCY